MTVTIGIIEGTIRLIDKVTPVADTVAGSFTKLGNKLATVGASMASVGQTLSTRITAPLAAVGAASIKFATDFESAWAGVTKTVDDAGDQFGELAQGFRDLSKEIPVNVTEILAVGEAAGQLGIETEHILDFTRTMVDLGVATNLSSDQAATSLARLANITGLPQTEFDRLGSTIVALGNNFATTESEIVEMSLRLAGAGSAVGMTEGQILALATALTSVGINAEAGGSAFSRVINDMAMSVAEGGESVQGFADIAGVSIDEFSRLFREDAAGALQLFVEGLGRATAEDRLLALDALGLSGIRVTDALVRVSGAGTLLADTLDLQATAWSENTALTIEAEQRYATFESKLTLFWNRLKDLGVTLGQIIIPKIIALIDIAAPLIDKFQNLSTTTQTFLLVVGGIAAAIGPVIFIFGQLAITLGALSTAFGFSTAAVTAFLIPLAPLVIALGVVTAAAILMSEVVNTLQRDIEEIVTATNSFTDGIDAIGQSVEDVIASNDLGAMNELLVDQESALKNARIELVIAKKEVDRLSQSEHGFGINLEAATIKMNEANQEVNTLTASTDTIRDAVDNWTESVEELGGTGSGSTGAIPTMTAAIREQLQEVNDWQVKINELNTAIASQIMLTDTISLSINSVEMSTDDLVSITDELVDEMLSGVDASIGYAEGLDFVASKETKAAIAAQESAVEFSNWGQIASDAIGDVIDGSRSMGDILKDILVDKVKQWMGQFVNSIVSGFAQAAGAASSSASTTGSVWSMAGQAITGWATKAAVSWGTAALGIGTSTAAAGTAAAGTAAATAGAWATAGAGLSAAWTGAMAVMASTGVLIWAAAAIAIVAAFSHAGRTVEERLDEWITKMEEGEGTLHTLTGTADLFVETMNRVATSEEWAARAAENLNASFGRFVAVARQAGDVGLEQIKRIVDAARASGVDMAAITAELRKAQQEAFDIIAERAQFIMERVGIVADSILTLIGDASSATAAEIKFAASSMLSSFSMMVSAGMPLAEILGTIGELVTNITTRGEELGLSLGEEFGRLGEMITILSEEKFQRLIEKLDATGAAVQAMGEMGILSIDQFRRLQNVISGTFDSLTEGGLTGVEALASMAPQLQILLNASQQYGFSIKDSTQELIDQGLQMGILSDQNMDSSDIMIAGFTALLEGVNALIVALGGVPIEFNNWNSSMDTTADNFSNQLDTMGGRFDQFADDMNTDYDIAMGDITSSTVIALDVVDEAWQTSTDTINAAWMDTSNNVSSSLEAIGIVSIAVFDSVAQTALEQADATTSSWHDAIDDIFDDYNEMIDDLPSPPAIPPGGGGNNGGGGAGGSGIPQFQGGSNRFLDFGAGTQVELHDREQVVTHSQGASLASQVGSAIQHAMSSGGGSGSGSTDRLLSNILIELQRNTNSFNQVAGELAAVKARVATSRGDSPSATQTGCG
jgi:TP901 family phage tail tape measure protein